ncbi:MAG: hypothetical protein AAGA06_04775 [Pseudomonadota bacterium]
MLPAANAPGLAIKPASVVTTDTSARAAQTPTPETARSSAGEASSSQVALLSPKAVTAPEQTAVAPRLREQETAERTDRSQPAADTPTGPPPTFEESPLERQARVALAPPEVTFAPGEETPEVSVATDDGAPQPDQAELAIADAPPQDPPPTPSERAEASFAETRTMSEAKEPAIVDVAR